MVMVAHVRRTVAGPVTKSEWDMRRGMTSKDTHSSFPMQTLPRLTRLERATAWTERIVKNHNRVTDRQAFFGVSTLGLCVGSLVAATANVAVTGPLFGLTLFSAAGFVLYDGSSKQLVYNGKPVSRDARVPSPKTMQAILDSNPIDLEAAIIEHVAREASLPFGKIPEE